MNGRDEQLRHYELQLERGHRSFSDNQQSDPTDEIHRIQGIAQQTLEALIDAAAVADRAENNWLLKATTLERAVDTAVARLTGIVE